MDLLRPTERALVILAQSGDSHCHALLRDVLGGICSFLGPFLSQPSAEEGRDRLPWVESRKGEWEGQVELGWSTS